MNEDEEILFFNTSPIEMLYISLQTGYSFAEIETMVMMNLIDELNTREAEAVSLEDDETLTRQEDGKVVLYKSSAVKTDDCSICMSTIKRRTHIARLKRDHVFHFGCVDEWTHYSDTCPVCRNPIK